VEARKAGSLASKIQFSEIRDEAVIARVLDVAQRKRVPLTLWLKKQSVKFDTHFAYYLQFLRKLAVQLPSTINLEEFSAALSQQGSEEIFGSFQVDTVFYFFKTPCMLRERNAMPIEVPRRLYKLQRRAHMRLPFERQNAPKLRMFDPSRTFPDMRLPLPEESTEYRVLDLSLGGVGIAVKQDEGPFFKPGRVVHDVKVSVKGISINTDCIVQNRIPSANDQGTPILRIGLRFLKLENTTQQLLANYVIDECRRRFTILY
jgi:hypothetical protein